MEKGNEIYNSAKADFWLVFMFLTSKNIPKLEGNVRKLKRIKWIKTQTLFLVQQSNSNHDYNTYVQDDRLPVTRFDNEETPRPSRTSLDNNYKSCKIVDVPAVFPGQARRNEQSTE